MESVRITVRQDEVPFDRDVISNILERFDVEIGRASIREINQIVTTIEKRLGVKFIRMEFGIPGLPPCPIGIEAEVEALREMGVPQFYPPFDGIPRLKKAAAEFVKNFINIDISPECCFPTCGAMQGGLLAQAIAGRLQEGRDTILFLDPGFPVNKIQNRFLGLQSDSIDFYDLRGERLIEALDQRLSRGDVGGVMWSSPNNPTWICLQEEELKGMGELFNRYKVVAIEDLAYFGMDFRANYGQPGRAPFNPTIARYTNYYFMIISSSKIFSYAGQRVAVTVISPKFIEKKFPNLEKNFGKERVGTAFLHGGIYPLTSGVAHSAQHGLAAMLEKANRGEYDFLAPVKEYAQRARVFKKAFLDHGFHLVYDNDIGEPLADGFYFTCSYPGFSGAQLLEELLYYGISSITLQITGSTRGEGLRICVSTTPKEEFERLDFRLRRFEEDHPV
ncbi:pyridoxal phosphate-dependent aminotransferase [candidate division KSB1 bacterium]|nr:pyridoxal phosphate-dependent aminotransferase [candidate division KSB1 bacterium]